MVDLAGLQLLEHCTDIAIFEEFHVDELDVGENAQLLKSTRIDAGVPALGPDHTVAFFEEGPGEVGTILA